MGKVDEVILPPLIQKGDFHFFKLIELGGAMGTQQIFFASLLKQTGGKHSFSEVSFIELIINNDLVHFLQLG
jgi:hypothetical protein